MTNERMPSYYALVTEGAADDIASRARDAELAALIREYLSAGGLFNPELMEHEKVRELLIACRDVLTRRESARSE